ncbi:hypothetical protein [Pseudoalteromonas maricaloris]|uniref:hypothetical protein n=1 Tax=Pseudoalteromonas maricaloris TaxID=184924 RepID=UPI00029AE7D9|nr:hypothetical protein [Pseudoalteromonas flavipulchra]
MKLYEFVENKLKNTLFIATNSIDIATLAELGVVNFGIVLNIGEQDKSLLNNTHVFDLSICRKKVNSVSELPSLFNAKEYLNSIINEVQNIWLFRPYPWSDDFELKGKKLLCNPFFSYQSISRKLHQDHILYTMGTNALRSHIAFKEELLSRKILVSLPNISNDTSRLFFSSFSTGCSGVSTKLTRAQLSENLYIKSDRLINKSIPLCQNAVIIGEDVIKYQPKVSIVRHKGDSLVYGGGDFLACNDFIPDEVFKKMSYITHHVGITLKKMGFLGVINCDYIYSKNENDLIFIEVNPRYSACTFIIDKFFSSRCKDLMPTVLHTLAFYKDQVSILDKKELNSYKDPDTFIPLPFEKGDWVSFLNENETKDKTQTFCHRIVSNPEFPVTLTSSSK